MRCVRGCGGCGLLAGSAVTAVVAIAGGGGGASGYPGYKEKMVLVIRDYERGGGGDEHPAARLNAAL